MSTQIEQTVITDSSHVTSCSTFKPVLDLIPSENYVQKDIIVVTDQEEEEEKKEMVEEVISWGFHVDYLITTGDDTSSVTVVEIKKEEDSEEPISQIENGVKKNQECEEPVGKYSIELCGSFIAEKMKENQEEMSSEDVIMESSVKDSSAKEEVCQVHSLPPSMSQYKNVLVNMISESSSRIQGKQEEVFQVQDVITGDEHIILVVERTQDGFVETKSISPSQNLVEILDKKTTNQEMTMGSGDTNWWGKWGEFLASGSSSNGMAAEIGSTRIVNGNGCARKELMDSAALGKRRSGIFTEHTRQRRGKCSRNKFTETNLKKEVLSMFAEARNVFCQKKSDGIKQSYSREEMEALRFENSYQQRQIWREIYTGLGPVVATELNFLAKARQNGNAITNQQHHHQPQLHCQHPRQHQQYPLQSRQHQQYPLQSLQHHQYPQQSRQRHQYPQQQQQHHQHPKKPPQHHHNHHQHQQAGVNKENAPPQHHHHHNHHQH